MGPPGACYKTNFQSKKKPALFAKIKEKKDVLHHKILPSSLWNEPISRKTSSHERIGLQLQVKGDRNFWFRTDKTNFSYCPDPVVSPLVKEDLCYTFAFSYILNAPKSIPTPPQIIYHQSDYTGANWGGGHIRDEMLIPFGVKIKNQVHQQVSYKPTYFPCFLPWKQFCLDLLKVRTSMPDYNSRFLKSPPTSALWGDAAPGAAPKENRLRGAVWRVGTG